MLKCFLKMVYRRYRDPGVFLEQWCHGSDTSSSTVRIWWKYIHESSNVSSRIRNMSRYYTQYIVLGVCISYYYTNIYSYLGIYTYTQCTYKKYIYISLLNSNIVRDFDHQFQRTEYIRVENKMIFNLLYCFMIES